MRATSALSSNVMSSEDHRSSGPNDPILHPETGVRSYGIIPEGKSRGDRIPSGPIELRVGKHNGPNSGFGAKHIWAEHQAEMAQADFNEEQDVARYVAWIITTGTPIYYEGGRMRHTRITVVRSARGMAVLEMKGHPDECVWSVVTAYNSTKANGTRVGAVA